MQRTSARPPARVTGWSFLAGDDAMARRAGGRRHHNAVRRLNAERRRWAVMADWCRLGGILNRGVQSRLADKYGVHKSTICRDIKTALREMREHWNGRT